jgi:hypothetical protein
MCSGQASNKEYPIMKLKDRSQESEVGIWFDGLEDFGFAEGGFYQLTNW